MSGLTELWGVLDLVQDRRRPRALEKPSRVGPNSTDQIRILQQVI